MPSFSQTLDTLARWREFPGLERLDDARVALTFDDGPDPDGTPDVLDALDAAGLRATFFMVGEQVKAAPTLAREVAGRGHEIALHGATGEDGSLRGVLDLCGVPYVGCDARASRLAWDKPSAKSMLLNRTQTLGSM